MRMDVRFFGAPTMTRRFILPLAALAMTFADPAGAADVERRFQLDARLYSYSPNLGIDSFVRHGEGSIGGTGRISFACFHGRRRFNVELRPFVERGKYGVAVKVVPQPSDPDTESKAYRINFTDLGATSLDVERDEDGRIYVLSMMPGVQVTDNTPQQFDPAKLQFETWRFNDSTIILNDEDYIGKMRASGGQLAWIDIPGLARIEFSLFELKESKPLGVLKDGRIKIVAEDGTALEIHHVTNGLDDTNDTKLKGGPYRVWVRWTESSATWEEYQAQAQARLLELESKLEEGDTYLTLEQIRVLRERSSRPFPGGIIGNGVRGLRRNERVEN